MIIELIELIEFQNKKYITNKLHHTGDYQPQKHTIDIIPHRRVEIKFVKRSLKRFHIKD